MVNKMERRVNSNCQLRAVNENGARVVYWTPIIKEVESSGLWFTEILDKDAFNNADMSDVRGLYNHDESFVMGRSKSGTLSHSWNANTLECRVELSDAFPDFQWQQMERGDVSGGSFGFIPDYDSYQWTRDDNGHYTGRLMRVMSVFEVSVVTFPAYPQTEGSVTLTKRSLERFIKEHPPVIPLTKEDIQLRTRLGLV